MQKQIKQHGELIRQTVEKHKDTIHSDNHVSKTHDAVRTTINRIKSNNVSKTNSRKP